MDSDDYTAIAHEGLAFMNPLAEEDVDEMFKETIKRYGTVDILVNNEGLQKDAKFHEMSLEEWNRVIGINLTGQFLCARSAIREFLRRGVVQSRSVAAIVAA